MVQFQDTSLAILWQYFLLYVFSSFYYYFNNISTTKFKQILTSPLGYLPLFLTILGLIIISTSHLADSKTNVIGVK